MVMVRLSERRIDHGLLRGGEPILETNSQRPCLNLAMAFRSVRQAASLKPPASDYESKTQISLTTIILTNRCTTSSRALAPHSVAKVSAHRTRQVVGEYAFAGPSCSIILQVVS